MNWHNMRLSQVKDALNIKSSGLTNKDIELRILTDGENSLEKEKEKNIFQKIFEQSKSIVNLFVLVAFILSVVSVVLNHGQKFYEPILIFLLLIFNIVLGIIIGNRSAEIINAQKSKGIFAKVLREGVKISVNSESLVPGDIIYVEAGDIVPADARLLESANLKCEESAVVGNHSNTEKDADAVVDEDAPLNERVNMIYSGCTVTYGCGTAVVTETGANTETGKIITESSENSRYESPVLNLIKKWKLYFGITEAALCGIIVITGLIKGLSAPELLRLSCNVLLAAVPECIFIIIAFASDFGKKASKIITTEKLGHITVLCTEKSGALTHSEITAEEVWTKGEPQKLSKKWSENTCRLMEYAVLCSNSTYEESEYGEEIIEGEPIEKAILKAAANNGITVNKLLEKFPRVDELPFDSERKLMTTIHEAEGRYFAVVKGAPEIIITRCSEMDKKNLLLHSSRMAQNAMRVIAVAVRELDADFKSMSMNDIESSLSLVGIIGMSSPTREDTKIAVKRCKNAGIKTVMVTGDHLETATAVAEQVGICKGSEQAISGVALSKLLPAQFERSANKFTVFARVSPRDKVKIVQSLQNSGETVAMTGKGINDVPAIKCADIGCVMGNKGDGLTRGAADIIFDEENISAVVSAVKEGRIINSNIKKIFGFMLSCMAGELIALLLTTAFSLCGFGTLSLLVLNMLIALLPLLSLWGDTTQRGIMKESPKKYNESFFSERRFIMAIVRGVLIGLLSVIFCTVSKGMSSEYSAALVFAVLSFSFIFNLLSVKGTKAIIKNKFSLNTKSFISMGISLVLTLLIVLVPNISSVFGFEALGFKDMLTALAFALIPFVISEAVNLIVPIINNFKVKK